MTVVIIPSKLPPPPKVKEKLSSGAELAILAICLVMCVSIGLSYYDSRNTTEKTTGADQQLRIGLSAAEYGAGVDGSFQRNAGHAQ